MKHLNLMIASAVVAALLLVVVPSTNAQVSREDKKEAKAIDKHQKETAKSLYSKAPKDAQKEAKKLEKQGWKSMGLPIAKQLDNTWMKMSDLDPMTGYNRFIWSEQTTVANTYSAAQMEVENLCKVRIAGQLQTTIMSEAKVELANRQLSAKDAASYEKALEKSTAMVAQKLGRLVKTLEIYRVVNDNYEVRVIMFYDMKTAMDQVKADAVNDLKKSMDEFTPTHEKMLDEMFDSSRKTISQEE